MFVKNEKGNYVDFDAVMNIADRELCEQLHEMLAPCTEQEFFDEYVKVHEKKHGAGFVPYVGGAW